MVTFEIGNPDPVTMFCYIDVLFILKYGRTTGSGMLLSFRGKLVRFPSSPPIPAVCSLSSCNVISFLGSHLVEISALICVKKCLQPKYGGFFKKNNFVLQISRSPFFPKHSLSTTAKVAHCGMGKWVQQGHKSLQPLALPPKLAVMK